MREKTSFSSKFCAHAGATCELAPQQEPHLGYKKPASRVSVPKEHCSDNFILSFAAFSLKQKANRTELF
jgi:hypothetical protein